MTRLRTIPAIALFVLRFTPASSAAPVPLTVDESVEIALEQNPSQQAARSSIAAAEAVLERVRADRRASVDVVASGRSFETHAFLPSDLAPPNASTTVGPTEEWSVALEGRYSLYDAGRNRARVEAAAAARDASVHEASTARGDLALAVHRIYRALEAAEAARTAAASRLERSADHVRLAQSRLDAGASPPADVTRARVEHANARAAVASAEADMRAAAAALNALLGRSAEEAVVIVPATRAPATPGGAALETSIRTALSNNPELLAAHERVSKKKAETSLAAATSGLSAELRARYGLRDEELFPSDRDYSLGFVISKSVFDGGRRKAEVARAKAETAAEEAKTAALENEIRRAVVEADARIVEAYLRAAAAEAAHDAAEQSVRLMRSRYEAGAAPIGDLLDAASDLDAAISAVVAARMNIHVAVASLAHVRGDLVTPHTKEETKEEGEQP